MVLQSLIYTPPAGDAPASLRVLNQLQLPHQTTYVEVADSRAAFAAIRSMMVRGAPVIALVAALGLACEDPFGAPPPPPVDPSFSALVAATPPPPEGALAAGAGAADAVHWYSARLEYLVGSRPTAVNLADAAHRLTLAMQAAERAAGGATAQAVRAAYVEAAGRMLVADVADNRAIGAAGCAWIRERAGLGHGGQAAVLTHCNTGSLATAGYGTALGVVRALHAAGALRMAFYTETRPYNQGSRLTGFELLHDGIPGTLVADGMAAALMRSTRDLVAVVVGADRVAANGDTANKIGTYGLACLARHHGVKFLVAAPRTTIDLRTASGADIVIEERPPPEILAVRGPRVLGYDAAAGVQKVDLACVETVSTAALGTRAWNPAFDVTPADLIDGIVTEVGVAEKVGGRFDLAKLFDLQGPG